MKSHLNNPVLKEALNRLVERGLVQKIGDHYHITDSGTEAVKQAQSKPQPTLSMTLSKKRGA